MQHPEGNMQTIEIGQRVGRNQATMMRIFHCGMQEETTNRWDQSHPPSCTIVHDDRWIVCLSAIDRTATSRTIAQHIQSVTHHLVFACTIRRRLQQSEMLARCPLLRLPLTGNHRRLRPQWCDEQRT
ncbi:transposable element Tcb1 transposase [Trichonephila clavipes]|nr:transposable element Tcb1 transposase [Trichonephila clavipes]